LKQDAAVAAYWRHHCKRIGLIRIGLCSYQEVAEIAEIKMPTVYVIPTDEMNAFAAGFDPKQDAVVAATEGIIKRLEPDELKAVIGHEIGHIVHGDMVSGESSDVRPTKWLIWKGYRFFF
jgi:predicted Zn-dependent protease